MTKRLGICAGLLSFLVLATGIAPARAENVELRIATLAPDGSDWMKEFDKAAAEVKEKTSGRVTLKYFAGGQQGDERDYIRKIKLGQLDGAGVTSIGLSMIDESIRVLELPMLFKDVGEVDYVADMMWGYFQKKFEAKGFKLNDRGEVGWIYVISKDKLETLDQIRAAKIWQWGDDNLIGTMFKKLKLTGVPLGVPEVDSSLTSGRITAAYGSPYAAVALQWFSKVKYMTSMPMSFAIGASVIALSATKKVSADDQKVVESIGKSSAKKLRKVIRKANDEAKGTMAKRGIKIVVTPQATIDAFEKAAKEVQEELTGKIFSKQELEMVIKYRDQYRAKNPKK
jgi:TRAP-type C4-dicarboxylate transport system substrate-binding protein